LRFIRLVSFFGTFNALFVCFFKFFLYLCNSNRTIKYSEHETTTIPFRFHTISIAGQLATDETEIAVAERPGMQSIDMQRTAFAGF
jgi:hypothetical protein